MLCFYITPILLILGCLSTLVIGNNLTECPQYIKEIQWGNGAKGFKGSIYPKSAKACQKWCQAPGSVDFANRPCVGWSFWAEPGLWSSSTWCYLFSNEDGPLQNTTYPSPGAVSGLRLDCESDLETVEFMSSGDGGIRQEKRMGTYTKTNQLVQGFPVYEQNVEKLNKKQFVFVGPYGNWRVGPDTTTYRGSALKNPKRSPTPPRTGWQYYDLGKWIKDNSIEAIVKIKGCASGEIACTDGQGCIPDSYKCDGNEDCSDGSDESLTICVKSCSYDEFSCANGYQCIPDNYKCDGEEDCSDGSDESSTICKKVCSYEQFACADGYQCIPDYYKCDREEDCTDSSDESSNICQKSCENGTFACADGRECILGGYKCDDKEDCFDGSDESSITCGVESCSCSDFMNHNGYGQCKKGDRNNFGGSVMCYVNLPSNCSDLSESGTDPGRWRSAEACGSNSGKLTATGPTFKVVRTNSDGRMATVEEVRANRQKVVGLLGHWHIALLDGGKVDGKGYGGLVWDGDFEHENLGHKIVIIGDAGEDRDDDDDNDGILG